MAELDIVGQLSPEQAKDTIDTIENRTRTLRQKALKEYERQQAKLFKLGKPFCFRCAKLDYEKQQSDLYEVAGTKQKYLKELHDQGLNYTEKNIPVKVDLKPYGEEKRFKLIKQDTQVEVQRVNGARIKYTTFYDTYRCMTRGCHISIQTSERLDNDAGEAKKK